MNLMILIFFLQYFKILTLHFFFFCCRSEAPTFSSDINMPLDSARLSAKKLDDSKDEWQTIESNQKPAPKAFVNDLANDPPLPSKPSNGTSAKSTIANNKKQQPAFNLNSALKDMGLNLKTKKAKSLTVVKTLNLKK